MTLSGTKSQILNSLKSICLDDRPLLPKVGDKWPVLGTTWESQLDSIKNTDSLIFHMECISVGGEPLTIRIDMSTIAISITQ